MATTKFYLDPRRTRGDGTCPLKLAINKDSHTRYIHLNLYLSPNHWDSSRQIVIHHNNRAFLNTYIHARKQEVDEVLLRLIQSHEIARLTIQQLKERIIYEITPESERTPKHSFEKHFLAFTDTRQGTTQESYLYVYKHLAAFVGDRLPQLTFDDITPTWLADFDSYLAQQGIITNSRNLLISKLRAVFNDAIKNEITTAYPFRRFTLKTAETAKRSLTIYQLRAIFHCQGKYVDIFKLLFLLIGINLTDLYSLTTITNGRIEYRRAKTNKLYSIKVEPEAMDIIQRYKGETHLVNIAERHGGPRAYNCVLNAALKLIQTPLGTFPTLSTYYARHTWATMAAELDIPDDTISRALGHTQTTGARVTQVYINFNRRKIDEANRRVIDYVLYDKR